MNSKEYLIESVFEGRYADKMSILDIGSNDGKFINGINLIPKGWNAYLVEPSIKSFEKLKHFHALNKKVKCFPFAISDNNGQINIYEKEEVLVGEDIEEVEETIRKKRNLSAVKATCMDFYAFCITADTNKFNLIRINTGGIEYEILNQINLESVECEMLIIYYNSIYKDMYVNYVTPFGLKLIFDDKETLIFTK